MKDPYKVLGVSPEADDEEIKKAYRALAKKYHPDNYANTEFSDIAGEKMKEINEAYDEILHARASGSSSQQSGYGASGGQNRRVRDLIAAGRLGEAEVILDSDSNRNAEWNYLKGLCAMYRRSYYDAAGYFQTASSMEPGNREYATMYQRFRSAQQNYGTFGGGMNGRECNTCDICSNLICLDCMCEMCGGDLIGCC